MAALAVLSIHLAVEVAVFALKQPARVCLMPPLPLLAAGWSGLSSGALRGRWAIGLSICI
jgi:hypothetical protein